MERYGCQPGPVTYMAYRSAEVEPADRVGEGLGRAA
ncbi:hypothetical protein GA0070614_2224 [Micromonospora coxensis]|uniref:Uncharacterized protein n=1 Tax=Micromonospora coxensis TaxID=356852 RepID=A0A1C5I4N3_9ACTN|nr:hypothetical protein GA0070614_2224 [Micromonospora coxensis]